MKPRILNALRWTAPVLLTGLLIALLAHTSRDGEVLARYSRQYFRLLLSMAFLTAVAWWIALNRQRYDRFLRRVLRPGSMVVLAGALALLALIDIVVDLRLLLSLSPLLLGVIILWLAAAPEEGRTEAILASNGLRNSALAVVAVLVSLLLAEAVFRGLLVERLNPTTDRQFYRAVAQTWPRSAPLGRSEGVARVLGLADSFGQAGGAANFHYLLGEALGRSGRPVEIVNFSVAGHEPADELALLKGYGPRYQADLVLHSFFVGNDFNLPDRPLMLFQGVQFRPDYPAGLWSFRPRNFWLFQWLPRFAAAIADGWQRQREAPRSQPPADAPAASVQPDAPAGQSAAPSGVVSDEAFLRVERNRLNLMQVGGVGLPRWLETTAILDEIRSVSERMGSDYILVIHPDQLQVEEALFSHLVSRHDLDPAAYDLALPQKLLLDYCAQRQIRCIDLLPAFRERGAAGGLYLPGDTHYNRAGNELATEAILAALQATELLEQQSAAP